MARRGEGHLHPNHPSQVERGVPPKEGADVASLRAVMQAIEGCVTQALATPADPRLRGLAILVEALGVRKSREDTVTFLTAALMCMVWPGVSWQGTARLRHACRDADRKVRDYTMLLNREAFAQLCTSAKSAWHEAVAAGAAAAAAVAERDDAAVSWAEAVTYREVVRLRECEVARCDAASVAESAGSREKHRGAEDRNAAHSAARFGAMKSGALARGPVHRACLLSAAASQTAHWAPSDALAPPAPCIRLQYRRCSPMRWRRARPFWRSSCPWWPREMCQNSSRLSQNFRPPSCCPSTSAA